MYENHQKGSNHHSFYKNSNYNHHTGEEEDEYVVMPEEDDGTYMDMDGRASEDPYCNMGYTEETYEVPETPKVTRKLEDSYVAFEENAEDTYTNMNGDSSSSLKISTNTGLNVLSNSSSNILIRPSSSSGNVQHVTKSLNRGCQNSLIPNKAATQSRAPSQKRNSIPVSVNVDTSHIVTTPTMKIKSHPPTALSILEEYKVSQHQKNVTATEEVYGTQCEWQREVGGRNETENMVETTDELNEATEEPRTDCYSYPYVRDTRNGIEVKENRAEVKNESFEMTPNLTSPTHINEVRLKYLHKNWKQGKEKRRNFVMLLYKVLIILLLVAIVGMMTLQYETLKSIKREMTSLVVVTTSSPNTTPTTSNIAARSITTVSRS